VHWTFQVFPGRYYFGGCCRCCAYVLFLLLIHILDLWNAKNYSPVQWLPIYVWNFPKTHNFVDLPITPQMFWNLMDFFKPSGTSKIFFEFAWILYVFNGGLGIQWNSVCFVEYFNIIIYGNHVCVCVCFFELHVISDQGGTPDITQHW